MFLQTRVLLGVLLLIGITSCKYCGDDCIKISSCAMALDRVKNNKNIETANMLKNAFCGFDDEPKVCCTEFIISMRSFENDPNDEFEVDKHPNVILLTEDCGDIEGGKIVGGYKASPYEFPWLAIILYKVGNSFSMNCGGSVINSRYVLTAAHCIIDRNVAKVRIGEYDMSSDVDCSGEDGYIECAPKYQEIDVSEPIPHEAYRDIPFTVNDIGLLRLKTPADLSLRNSGTICLPITNVLLTKRIYGERATVAGWGITENQTKSDALLRVDVPTYSPRECLKRYSRNGRVNLEAYNRLTYTFCAGELGHDSCKGDSGGPLMVESIVKNTYKQVQYGIVSYGNNECGSEPPTIYTDVRKYMKWILDHIRP